MELENSNNGGTQDPDDLDSTCSTPYVSAPSSPGRPSPLANYYFSAPTSPMHYILSSTTPTPTLTSSDLTSSGSFEFDFSSNHPASAGSSPPPSMISADELFLNGKIRPMKLSSHLQRPQTLAPLLDVGAEEEEGDERLNTPRGRELRMRSRSVHRRARSMSPMRNAWDTEDNKEVAVEVEVEVELDPAPLPESASAAASSSRSSSKRWVFLKDLLYRSKSEGRGTASATKEKFWHAFKDKKSVPSADSSNNNKKEKKEKKSGPPAGNGAGGRRRASAHERHYTANRAVAEEMRRRTYLPYRQGLLGSLGCLGFSSRSYGAVNGFARSLNPVSTR